MLSDDIMPLTEVFRRACTLMKNDLDFKGINKLQYLF